MHSMSIGNFIKLLSALGYKLEIIEREEEKKWDSDKMSGTENETVTNCDTFKLKAKDGKKYKYTIEKWIYVNL